MSRCAVSVEPRADVKLPCPGAMTENRLVAVESIYHGWEKSLVIRMQPTLVRFRDVFSPTSENAAADPGAPAGACWLPARGDPGGTWKKAGS